MVLVKENDVSAEKWNCRPAIFCIWSNYSLDYEPRKAHQAGAYLRFL